MSEPLRIAVFHTELERDGPGLLLRDIVSEEDKQVQAVLRVIAAVGPDVIVLGAVDWDAGHLVLDALADRAGYPYAFASRPNTGASSGFDLDNDGRLDEPEDRIGFGRFVGQGGLAILSHHRVHLVEDLTAVPWRDVQGLGPPDDRLGELPVSSTAHWHLNLATPDGDVALMVWHATAPVFDGPEDRNGRRNHDEAALWLDHIATLPEAPFILAGFANLDPVDGDGRPEALNALMHHPRLQNVGPMGDGGRKAAERQGGANQAHKGDPALDTADWFDDGPGNLRVDYILPSREFDVLDAGVTWPDPGSRLGRDVESASRHRLVWIDLDLPVTRESNDRVGLAEIRH